MRKHITRFQVKPGIAPQMDLVVNSTPASRIEARRPIASASQPQASEPSTVPAIPTSGSSATGSPACGCTGELRPYSAATPGATNASAAGFIASIVPATAITTISATCAGPSRASSSARTGAARRAAAARPARSAARGTSPATTSPSPPTTSAMPTSIGASGVMPAMRKPMSRVPQYIGRCSRTPTVLAATPAQNNPTFANVGARAAHGRP